MMENNTEPANIHEGERGYPWKVVRRNGSYTSAFFIEDADRNVVCNLNASQLEPEGLSIGRQQKNARLIAAAPALYRECEQGALTLDDAADVLEDNGLTVMASTLRIQAKAQRDVLKQATGTEFPSYGRVEQSQADGGQS